MFKEKQLAEHDKLRFLFIPPAVYIGTYTTREMKNKRFYERSRAETFHTAYVTWNTTDFQLVYFLSNYKIKFLKQLHYIAESYK